MLLVFGFFLTLVLAYLPLEYNRPGALQILGFLSGLLITGLASLGIQRLSRRPIKFAASGGKRRLKLPVRILVWIPSAIAVLVAFFFPIATHVSHPSSRYLDHYRIPIPWNFAVFPLSDSGFVERSVIVFAGASGTARLGMTTSYAITYWGEPLNLSYMVFGTDSAADVPQQMLGLSYGTTLVASKEFRLAENTFTCRRLSLKSGIAIDPTIAWKVVCRTPPAIREGNLHASFVGREEDLPTFYRIIEGITPVK